jgi:hypothetical protein
MYIVPFWTQELAMYYLFYHSIFQHWPTKIESFLQSWEWFVNSFLLELCVLRFRPTRNSYFHVVITCQYVARKMIFKSGKEVKITRRQIWPVWRMFQDCPPEALRDFDVLPHPSLSIVHLDRIWDLNTLPPHVDDSSLLPRKPRLVDDES